MKKLQYLLSLSAFVACAAAAANNADSWFNRLSPAMSAEEKSAYRKLATEAERQSFRQVFWNGKPLSETQFFERIAHADQVFGSGREGSGANTDQGRMYIASGPPTYIHRLPSSRIFVACEVWQYESLPATGYRSRLQFLFYRKAGMGDFRLFWPGLHSIRDLLIPQPGTRSMFPVNDVVTANDIRERLRYSPAEEEIVDAAVSVAKGITGTGNSEILSRAVSVAESFRPREGTYRPVIASKFSVVDAPEIRTLHFWAGDVPVTDVQIRAKASSTIGLAIDRARNRVEQSSIPLGLTSAKTVLYTQRFFLPPGTYSLTVEIDGAKATKDFVVSGTRDLSGEALEEQPGDLKIALLPDPRTADARAVAQSRAQ
jgi:GWxTD domain-containing protein